MSLVNPTLRQLQTPQIPTNLVQARIMQREEKRRRDEELAKIPITANLRTVKKIQAVLVDDGDDESVRQGAQDMNSDASGTATENSSISSSSLSPPSSTPSSGGSRPRSKTTTSSTVTVSVLTGGKQRGDRNHVEPVAIPKKLAEQVEHILGRKLAGKGSVLDEREQEREEEEARKAAEPLPPIVRGQPRKRALTSAHIRNLVSSWDHKVEEAKEITSEAEQIRQFLEERSAAHAELPKFSKVQLSGSELLKPLPSLPPPPPSSALGQKQKKSVPQRVDGHAKSASSASPYMSGHSAGSSSSLSSSSSTSVASTSLPPVKAISSEEEAQAQDATADPPVILVEDDKMASTSMTTTSSEDKAATEDGSQGQESKLLSKPALSAEMLDTKRSGEVLNNRAVMSRPRRAGARKPASTLATAQE
ncbi:hypothetical protein BGZ98_002485 [Dissophora globulifera]|nr:hypothetical protein BGZ98_002485 [Dissophora globulifera]